VRGPRGSTRERRAGAGGDATGAKSTVSTTRGRRRSSSVALARRDRSRARVRGDVGRAAGRRDRRSIDRSIPVNIPTLRERRGRRVKTHRRCSWWHPRCSRSHRTRRGTASRPRRRRQPVDGERRGARRSANEVRDIIYSLEPQLEGLFSDRSAPSHPSRGDARGRSTRRRATETSASMCSRDAAGEFSRERASRSP
jgi:hypothetical protein